MTQFDRDTYQLGTGRTFRANCGVLGIGTDLELHEGYDGDPEPIVDWDAPATECEFTKSEKLEIADFAINRWQQYKIKVLETKPEEPEPR